jgi:hypothetical protein
MRRQGIQSSDDLLACNLQTREGRRSEEEEEQRNETGSTEKLKN